MITKQEEKFNHVTASEIFNLLNGIRCDKKTFLPLALSNIEELKDFFKDDKDKSTNNYLLANYSPGEKIVESGKIEDNYLKSHKNFSYAEVPLGFIVKGDVIVSKGGKATKRLSQGDFIGLFETSDWILTGKKREIGEWSLTNDSPTKLIYFGATSLQGDDTNHRKLKNYLVDIAKKDYVPQPITTLPLLDWVANHTTKSRLNDYAIIAHTHLLPNNFPFFRQLSYLVSFNRMFVLEKPYSTVKRTFNDLVQSGCEVIPVNMEPGFPYEYSIKKSLDILWAKVVEEQKKTGFKKLLIIDDGGDLWLSIPWNDLEGVSIAGAEQTQRGITRIKNSNHHLPPIISVASSGVKKIVESIFIGRSVVNKLKELRILNQSRRIGIMGMGSIGQAATQRLNELGYKPLFYDYDYKKDSEMSNYRSSIDVLLNQSDIIIGTTGNDSLKGIPFERVRGRKILTSASSADVEFACLLKIAESTASPFGTRYVKINDNLSFDILNGGYPINFDRQGNATPSEDIVLTRCLMYTGAMQSSKLIESGVQEGAIYNLDIITQQKLLEKWIEDKNKTGHSPDIKEDEIDNIIKHSNIEEFKNMESVWED